MILALTEVNPVRVVYTAKSLQVREPQKLRFAMEVRNSGGYTIYLRRATKVTRTVSLHVPRCRTSSGKPSQDPIMLGAVEDSRVLRRCHSRAPIAECPSVIAIAKVTSWSVARAPCPRKRA